MKKKIEADNSLKWWEAKQGITPVQKKEKLEKKAARKEKRKNAEKYAEKASGSHPKKTTSRKVYDSHREHDAVTPVQKKIPHNKTMPVSFTAGSSLFDPAKIPQDAKTLLENFNAILSSNLRLTSKQRALLPEKIMELSHHLTDNRSERRLGYMNSKENLSAYIHYFMRWNLVRLVRLFSNLDDEFFLLKDGSLCLDIGSGPLTVPAALFLARPELRTKKITFYCMDISQTALSEGEDIFLSIAAALKAEPWKIIRVKGEFGTAIKEKVSLVTCANMFNEITEDFSMPPDYIAKKHSQKILSYLNADEESRVLLIEPGVPKPARLISLIRDAFIRKGFVPVSPCTHCAECPMNGSRGEKWCNFAFSTLDAPHELQQVSKKAGLNKTRAVLSFTALTKERRTDDIAAQGAKKAPAMLAETNENFVQKETCAPQKSPSAQDDLFLTFRIASDEIRLPGNRHGYYACSEKGLLLIQTSGQLFSGQKFTVSSPFLTGQTDKKTGALIVEM